MLPTINLPCTLKDREDMGDDLLEINVTDMQYYLGSAFEKVAKKTTWFATNLVACGSDC